MAASTTPISTYRTYLMYKANGSSDYTKLCDIKSFPDMGGEPVGAYRWGKGGSRGSKAKDNDINKLRVDSIHLNEEGKYLQACTWLAALFDDDLSRLAYKPQFLSEEKAALMRECAVKAVKAR